MAMPCWQERPVEKQAAVRIPFLSAKKFFAVDASGSTCGAIMRAQEKFVEGLHGNDADQVTKWDHVCQTPTLVNGTPKGFYAGSGGTFPQRIPQQPETMKAIEGSELWLLLTDGEISQGSVTELTNLSDATDLTQVPVVLTITGGRYSTPELANISVGIPFFASAREALILFKDYSSGQIFIIDAKGTFEPLKGPQTKGNNRVRDLSSWDVLPSYRDEAAFCKACGELGIDFENESDRRPCRSVSLGSEWNSATDNSLVIISELLEQGQIMTPDLRNLLGEEAINQLALVCKTRGQLPQLRDLLLRHKQQEVVVRLEDRHGAGIIMEEIQAATDPAQKMHLMEKLRDAHTLNRDSYQRLKDSPSTESRLAAEINRLINRALAIISDYEKSEYTADILNRKSNRAMRAGIVSAADADIHVSALELSDEAYAFRATCSICCGEDQIMSIVLKHLDTVEENTTDFALNFPLAAGWSKHNKDMVSSQCICFQCALVLERSIFQENIVATLPTVDYHGPNKRYINHQLTLALTAGLETGASGILQLFMTILDRTLETKSWCSMSSTEDLEVRERRRAFEWTLFNLLRNCPCRETFSETGPWVQYPAALTWATKDYADATLDSWIIQYPLTGFNQLLQWYSLLELPVKTPILIIKQAKLLHLTTAAIMNGLLRERSGDKSWTYPFLQLIYKEFNTPGVPVDLGQASLMSAEGHFWTRLEVSLGEWQDVKRFLNQFSMSERREMLPRIQVLAFWAIFTQKGHTMPKTFFSNIKNREPLAPSVLDPKATVSAEAIRQVLLSIFVPDRKADNHSVHQDRSGYLPPFVSPYGPSVLGCGYPGCNVKFWDTTLSPESIDSVDVRDRRTTHLADVFGTTRNFASQTGLPEPTKAPKAPTSYHNAMHVSIARIWASLPVDQKRAVLEEVAVETESQKDSQPAISQFCADVRLEICSRSGRGNIYSADIDSATRQILPSLAEALRVASQKTDLEDRSGASFVHDWTQNTIIWKIEYELGL